MSLTLLDGESINIWEKLSVISLHAFLPPSQLYVGMYGRKQLTRFYCATCSLYIYLSIAETKGKKNKQIRKILGRRKWICLPFSCGIAWGWTHRAHILQTVSRHLDLVHKGWSGKNIESHAFKAWNQTNKKIFILFSESQHTHGPGVAVWKLYLLQNLSNK